MTCTKEIGGYFELELGKKYDNISGNVALNCARNCLRYIIKAYEIKEIYVPYYICPEVVKSIHKEDCNIKFYHIDKMFMPKKYFPKDAYILYVNYFGICARQVKELSSKYSNLIVDNAQAFFMPKYGLASFNSLRKFFGVPDGAFLYTEKTIKKELEIDNSWERFSHLLKRKDKSAKLGYKDYLKNEKLFRNAPIRKMSNITKALYNGIDLNYVKAKRLENFNCLHKALSEKNNLKIILDKLDIPMFYPYFSNDKLLKAKLISNNIYIPTYWKIKTKTYTDFIENMIPIPIDHRYGKEDIKYIIEKVKELEAK